MIVDEEHVTKSAPVKPFAHECCTVFDQLFSTDNMQGNALQKLRMSPMESFMQPFKWQLWLALLSSVLIVGTAMWCLDSNSPFQRFGYIHCLHVTVL